MDGWMGSLKERGRGGLVGDDDGVVMVGVWWEGLGSCGYIYVDSISKFACPHIKCVLSGNVSVVVAGHKHCFQPWSVFTSPH